MSAEGHPILFKAEPKPTPPPVEGPCIVQGETLPHPWYSLPNYKNQCFAPKGQALSNKPPMCCNKDPNGCSIDTSNFTPETIKDWKKGCTDKQLYHIKGNWTKNEAHAVCRSHNSKPATKAQLLDGQRRGAEWCETGWLNHHKDDLSKPKVGFPMQQLDKRGCNVTQEGNQRGIQYVDYDDNPKKMKKHGALCYGYLPKLTGGKTKKGKNVTHNKKVNPKFTPKPEERDGKCVIDGYDMPKEWHTKPGFKTLCFAPSGQKCCDRTLGDNCFIDVNEYNNEMIKDWEIGRASCRERV